LKCRVEAYQLAKARHDSGVQSNGGAQPVLLRPVVGFELDSLVGRDRHAANA